MKLKKSQSNKIYSKIWEKFIVNQLLLIYFSKNQTIFQN